MNKTKAFRPFVYALLLAGCVLMLMPVMAMVSTCAQEHARSLRARADPHPDVVPF